MKKFLPFLLTLSMVFFTNQTFAQRYFSEVFTDVSVTENVKYGSNITILPLLTGGEPALEDLHMDVYSPADDTASMRPVVLFVHAGDFLPPIVNQTPYGSHRDSCVVEICKEMAKRGFVAAALQIRLGWNPLGSDLEKKSTLLQAVYRTTQDMRTAVRFLRKHAAEEGNTLRINPGKIAVGGFDNAGYAAQNVANLKTLSQTLLPKFLDFSTTPPTPFIDTLLFGNPYGTDQAGANIPNHVEYSSDVSAVINIEGGLGDFGWIEADDPPTIGFNHTNKLDQPGIRDVTEGTAGTILIPDGAFVDTVVHRYIELGIHQPLIDAMLDDPITKIANERSGGLEGLFSHQAERIEGSEQCDPTTGAPATNYGTNTYPWNWYDENVLKAIWDQIPNQTIPSDIFICDFNTRNGGTNDADQAKTFIDTMATYIAPRLAIIMGLNDNTSSVTQQYLKLELDFKAYPNPVQEELILQANEPMQYLAMYDVTGRKVFEQGGLNDNTYRISRNSLPGGMYFLQVQFKKGILTESIVWK